MLEGTTTATVAIAEPQLPLRIVSWNVLADSYVNGHKVLDPDDAAYRMWTVRSEMIKDCVIDFNADICCFQEVDQFQTFYKPMMKSLGYKSYYMKRPTKRDGCLTAFRIERFQLLGHREVNLDSLAFIDGDRKSTKSKFFKNNVAILVALHDTFVNRIVIVANCHIHWNPSLEDVKCAQVALLLEKLAEFRSEFNNAPILWTGDFNSTPLGNIYQILTADVSMRHCLLQELSPLHIARSIRNGRSTSVNNPYYGSRTKFLCDVSLNRLCRWMRMLGISVACDSWDLPSAAAVACLPPNATGKSNKAMKASHINSFFDRACKERRVLLTTSKTLLERNTCPRHSRYVDPSRQAEELIALFHEFGLPLSRDLFLTVCGKCGGPIEIAKRTDPRIMGKGVPTDREVYACVMCAHPYWWNDEDNSSPAKALRKAEELYQMISQALNLPTEPIKGTPTMGVPMNATTISEVFSSSTGALIVTKRSDIAPLNDLRCSNEVAPQHAENSSHITDSTIAAIKEMRIDDSSECLSANAAQPQVYEEEFPVAEGAQCGQHIKLSEEFQVASDLMRARSIDALPQLSSVFLSLVGQEPYTTNWAGEFSGTLDYILHSQNDWEVEWARVCPIATQNHQHPCCNLPVSGSLNREVEVCHRGQSNYIHREVDCPQPSKNWPSDHFAVIAFLRLT